MNDVFIVQIFDCLTELLGPRLHCLLIHCFEVSVAHELLEITALTELSDHVHVLFGLKHLEALYDVRVSALVEK